VPSAQVASAIGAVQTAQRLGPALGPVIGGTLAGLLGLRRAFLVTAGFYAVALALVLMLYDETAVRTRAGGANHGRVTFRNVLALENIVLLMFLVFSIQFVDRSFGPVLPLYVEQIGVGHARVAVVSGVLFSVAAFSGALGNHICARAGAMLSSRTIIVAGASAACLGAALVAVAANAWALAAATVVFGIGLGAALTAAYAAAAAVIPAGSHGIGFGVLTTASLTGLAMSPVVSGLMGAANIRTVFVADAALMSAVALIVWKRMLQ
jgi:DHA1 family multidrug resistance protein-like MFS transporter